MMQRMDVEERSRLLRTSKWHSRSSAYGSNSSIMRENALLIPYKIIRHYRNKWVHFGVDSARE